MKDSEIVCKVQELLGPDVEDIPATVCALLVENDKLRSIIEGVNDKLVVNWIPEIRHGLCHDGFVEARARIGELEEFVSSYTEYFTLESIKENTACIIHYIDEAVLAIGRIDEALLAVGMMQDAEVQVARDFLSVARASLQRVIKTKDGKE